MAEAGAARAPGSPGLPRKRSPGADEDDGESAEEDPPFASVLPAALAPNWPAPRRAVLGDRSGVLAWIEYAAARAFLGGLARLPRPLRDGLVSGFARLAKAFDRRHSNAARVFLAQAFGQELAGAELERRVLDAWRHFFRITLDAEVLHRHVDFARIRERIDFDVCDDVREILASERGSILASPHLGDWESGSAILAWTGFDPFYAVAKPPRNRRLSIHLHKLRERRGVRMIPRRGAMRDAPAIVKGGGMIALVVDQRARKRPLIAPFFGRDARCDRSAAVLLKRLRAPVVIGACYLTDEPWRWRVYLPVVLWPSDLEGKSIEEVTARVNQEFEKLIRKAPEQYFWLHDRYRGT